MLRGLSGSIVLSMVLALAGCSEGDGGPGGSGGTGGTAGTGGSAGTGGTGGTAGTGGSAGTGGTAGTGGAAGTGGTGGTAGTGGSGGTDPCAPSGRVAFDYPSFDAEPDCIVPGVCLKRGRVKGLYNSAYELAPVRTVSPEGTLWALSTCAAATAPADFEPLVSLFSGGSGSTSCSGNCIGGSIVDADLCLWLPNENLFYDVVFSEWGSVEGSNFSYVRTSVDEDACGVAGATCGATCECPEGWVNRESDGICVLPDPCDSNPCGAGATCRRIGATSHRCECDTVEFTKPPGQTTQVDCVSAGVCLARRDQRGLYNSLEENQAPASGGCGVDPPRPAVPTFTEWARKPCASAAPSEFVVFLSDFFACPEVPRRIVGYHSCLHTLDDDAFWDIQFTDWCPNAQETNPSGCFSYVRWHAVADGVACP